VERQLGRVEDLAHVQPGERDLGRARQVQLVALRVVEVHVVGREEAGAVHRLLLHEHRRQRRNEALACQPGEGEAVERELE